MKETETERREIHACTREYTQRGQILTIYSTSRRSDMSLDPLMYMLSVKLYIGKIITILY